MKTFGIARLFLVAFAALAVAVPVFGHPPVPTTAVVKVERDGTILVLVHHDALAFALNDISSRVTDAQMHELMSSPRATIDAAFDDGRARIQTGCIVRADGQPAVLRVVESPSYASLKGWEKEHPDLRLPCKLDFRLTGSIPMQTKAVTLRLPDALGEVVVTFDRPGVEPLALPLGPSEESPPVDIRLATEGAPVDPQPGVSNDPGPWSVARRFVVLGFEHIIPAGLDHCLFVLGLFLLSPKIKPVLVQISAFTVAHTITLTLTSQHIIGLPPWIVEPTIAASVAFIGVENLITRRVHPWRVAVAFLFGLVHGMGVATAFNEAGFPPGQLITSLAAFTVGVEGGHLAVLMLAFGVLGWAGAKTWYRSRVAIPGSLMISAVAIYWMFDRITGALWPAG